ncbi:MAG TPA: hypothetical protein VHZ97_17080 [Pseudonocardiaceae bacterium]|nr:hypothetical protein [Pseudonocardiaceae bacterium]
MQDDRAAEQAEVGAARAWVLAQVEKLGQYGGPGLRPTSLNSQQRLGEPPAEVANKLDARQRAGFSPEGLDYPRRSPAVRGGVLAGLVALLGVVLLVVGGIGLATGGGVAVLIMTVVGLVALVGGVGSAIPVSLYANRDPLRLTHTDRHALHETKRWQSRQNWIGPLSGSVERRLVIVARDVVERIVCSPAWVSGHLAEHRTRLNLGAELDQIDEQAFGLATLRAQLAAGPQVPGDQRAVAAEQGWSRLVERVAGLVVYAQRLDGVQLRLAQEAAEYEAAYADGTVARLVAGAVRDELAADTLRSLSDELSPPVSLGGPPPNDTGGGAGPITRNET